MRRPLFRAAPPSPRSDDASFARRCSPVKLKGAGAGAYLLHQQARNDSKQQIAYTREGSVNQRGKV